MFIINYKEGYLTTMNRMTFIHFTRVQPYTYDINLYNKTSYIGCIERKLIDNYDEEKIKQYIRDD